MSNFQLVWRYSCLNLARTVRIFSVGMDEKRSVQRKSTHKRRIGRSHYEQCWRHKARTPRRPQQSYTYCELLQFIEIIYIINKCNQYVIFLSFIPFVSLYMRNIQTAVSSHPLQTGHMYIWTDLLGIVHTTISPNICCSSWNTLYVLVC